MITRLRKDIALKTALIYGIAGTLWILLSDNLLEAAINNNSALTQMQTYKGWFFVFVTTLLLYLGLRKSILVIKEETEKRRKAEERLQEINFQLEERVKMRTAQLEESNHEMEAFISSVSHELRAPLRSVKSFIEILSEDAGPNLNDENRRVMNIIRESSTQMQKLIDDLHRLSLVNRNNINTEKIKMKDMVTALANEQKVLSECENIQFEIDDMPDIMGDSQLIKQVWINIISNAIKFSRSRTEPKIKVYGKTENESAVFCVSDNGVGFNPDYTNKLFLIFSRLHSRADFEGTGIGLTVVRRIVQRHGGKVWANGVEGVGAEFCFSLPLKATN